ncbi:MAG: hypothetical protein IPM56_01730 [Ignavibacteriales bacterium]|nr:MAG: hypothetical protein IPM56_01730 [Ignavibacteriales bacterium]
MKELVEKLARENIRGSFANNATNDLTQNHFKEILNIWIESLIESFGKNRILDEDIKEVKGLSETFNEHYIEREKNGFQTALISKGNNLGSSIVTDNVKTLEHMLHRVRTNANDLLTLAIDKQNENLSYVENINMISKSNPNNENTNTSNFWEKYGRQIFIGVIITVIGGIILGLIL